MGLEEEVRDTLTLPVMLGEREGEEVKLGLLEGGLESVEVGVVDPVPLTVTGMVCERVAAEQAEGVEVRQAVGEEEGLH